MIFQHWWFINLGGLPVFKLQFFFWGGVWLITGCWLILTWHYTILYLLWFFLTNWNNFTVTGPYTENLHITGPVRECNSHHPQQDSQWGPRCNRRVNRRAITSHLLMLCLQMSRMPYSPPRAARKKMAEMWYTIYLYIYIYICIYIYQYVYMYIFCEYVSKYRMIM